MIPLLDLVAQYHTIKSEIDGAVLDVLESGKFILGPNVSAFEKEMQDYLGTKHAIGLASGTDALLIALRAVGVGEGDEVIVPAYSFFATVGTVLTLGATPVFVDVDPATYLINVEKMKVSISKKTKAVIPVHLYGQPADMDEILALTKEYNLFVIEDNAQALGADYKGKKTGALGHMGCLSFFPSKNLGAYGDAGMLLTNDDTLAEKARMLRTHGWKKKYFPEVLGYNSRLDELQAAILRVKLRHVEEWNTRRREIAHHFASQLVEFGLQAPFEAAHRTHVYHLFMIRFKNRDTIQKYMKESGVASEVYYPQALHLATPCRELGFKEGQFPVSEQASRELLALPLYPELSNPQMEEVLSAVQSAIKASG